MLPSMMSSNGSTNQFLRVDSDSDEGELTMPSWRWKKSAGEMYGDFIGYITTSPERIVELIGCIVIFVLGYSAPTWWSYEWDGIPIPYQETEAGDVILELDLNFDVLKETVPENMLLLIGIVIPVIVLLMTGICWGPPGDAHASLCVYFCAVGMNSFFTNVIKIYCGRLRPNFYGLCEFDAESKQCTANNSTNAHRSFPSGHSSLAFCSMTILCLYFMGKVGLHRIPPLSGTSGNYPSLRTKLLACLSFMVPIGVAAFVATSRVHDFYHHPVDVVAGAAIGVVCACFGTSLWYPSIFSAMAGYPLQYIFADQEPPPVRNVGDCSIMSVRS